MFDLVKLTREFPVEYDGIVQQLWLDIKNHYKGYAGGHLFRYTPDSGDIKRYENDDQTPLEDIGIPVPNNSIYAMTMDREKASIYGISYPDAQFFVYDLWTGITKDLGEFLTHKVYGGPEKSWRSVPRALYCDPETGYVYTSGDNGFLVRYRPGEEKLELTWMRLPGEHWEGLKSIDGHR